MGVVVLIAVLVFTATFYAAYSLAALWDARRGPSNRELVAQIRSYREAAPVSPGDNGGDPEGQEGRRDGFALGVRGIQRLLLRGLESRLAETATRRLIEARLKRAGLRLRAAEYLVMRAFWAFVPAVVTLAATRSLWLAVATGVAGFWAPEVVIQQATKRRMQTITRQLPEALTLLANSLRSGHSFLQAVDVAAGELSEPLAGELRQLLKETRVDIALEDALANLVNRVPCAEMQLVVTAVLIQRQVGGNLAQLLEQVAETVRQRLRIEGEVRSLTAQGRLSGWIIGLLPLVLGGFIFTMNPEYVGLLFSEPLGRLMVAVAGGMQVAGAAVIRRMVQLQV